jgi:hypothetical protein
MMLDILLEVLEVLGIIGLKRKKKKNSELASPDTNDPVQEKDHPGGISQEGIPVCAGCNLKVEKDAIYELGKVWCRDCYKSQVLKVQE